MAAKDKYHEATKNAIIKMSWIITHDPVEWLHFSN